MNMVTELETKIKKNKEILTANKKQSKELKTTVAGLERKRAEYLAKVSSNNADTAAQTSLYETEKELETAKEQLRDLERKTAEVSLELKEAKLNLENTLASNLRQELAKVREERELLRSELIPNAAKHLEELRERLKKLDGLVVTLSSELAQLTRESADIPADEVSIRT
jgi:chromosome segregation ATPase